MCVKFEDDFGDGRAKTFRSVSTFPVAGGSNLSRRRDAPSCFVFPIQYAYTVYKRVPLKVSF
jgi:hypothetical protein